jgi:hypothetical protein
MRNDQSRGQGRSALKIDSEAFDRAKRVLRSPIKKRSGGSEAASLLRCQPSRQKPNRFAESGHKSGYIFELGFVFASNPSILGFFEFQCSSCDRRQTAKIGSLASSVQLKPTGKPAGVQVSEAVENAAFD